MVKNVAIKNGRRSHFEAIFANVPLSVLICGKGGNITDINPFARKEFGYSAEEIIGKKMKSILIPLSPASRHTLKTPLPAGTASFKGIRKDGTEFPVHLKRSKYDDEKNIHTIYFITNIAGKEKDGIAAEKININTENKITGRETRFTNNLPQLLNSDQSLENVRAFQKAILDYAGAMIIVTDVNGLIKFFNHEASLNTGYSKEEVVNKKTPLILHDKDEIDRKQNEFSKRTGVKAENEFLVLVEKAKMGVHEEEEFTYIRKDKTRFPVSLTVTAVKDDKGNVIGFIEVAVDISERRKVEDELRKIKKLFLQLLKNYPDGIVSIINNEFRFVYTGGELHDRLNSDQSQLIGAELFPNFPVSLRSIIREKLKTVFSGGVTISNFEFPETIAGGIYMMDTFPLIEEGGVVSKAGLIIRNISAQKLTERELRKALEKEKELGEMKSRFVSMASHEFRTPLSTILSSSYLIEKYTTTDDQPKRQKHLQRIISSVSILTDILNDFLSLGKIEEGKVEVKYSRFNLEEMFGDTIKEIVPTLKRNQVIDYVHEGNPEVFLDKSLLKFILLNLVSNARKFSPENSLIEIKTGHRNEQVILSVRDHGIGISEQDQAHLMERFFRGANATNIQGTGLGLNIVAKYVEMMAGMLTFNSELEKGTEFIITLNDKTG